MLPTLPTLKDKDTGQEMNSVCRLGSPTEILNDKYGVYFLFSNSSTLLKVCLLKVPSERGGPIVQGSYKILINQFF